MTVPVPDQLEFISVADGVTRDFPYPKRFLQADEIRVLLRDANGVDTPQYLGQHFSIAGSSWPNGGAVSFYTAPPSGSSVVRYRVTQAKQTVDLENKQRNDAKAVEVQLDRLAMGLQDQVRVAERSLKFAVGTNVSDMKSLPLPERGKALVGNAAGDGYENAQVVHEADATALYAAKDVAVEAAKISTENKSSTEAAKNIVLVTAITVKEDAQAANYAKEQAELAAMAAGAPLFTSEPPLVSAPSPYLLQVAAGTQVWVHNGSVRTMVGWLGKVVFPSVSSLVTFSGVLGPVGTELSAGSYRYRTASALAIDYNIVTNSGTFLYVLPSNDGAYYFEAWNPAADAVTDDYDKLVNRCINLLPATNKLASNPISPRLYLGNKEYFIGSTISLKRSVHIIGFSSGINARTYGTILKFPKDTSGIYVNRGNTDGETNLPTFTQGADGSIFDGITIMSSFDVNSPDDKHGFILKARATLVNCVAIGFAGNGINIAAQGSAATVDRGLANCFRLTTCGAHQNKRHGLLVFGSDANAGVIDQFNSTSNGGYGVLDQSFLGNYYSGCHTSSNGFIGPSYAYAFASYDGNFYQTNPNATESQYVSTEPGTNSSVWVPSTNLNSDRVLPWVPGMAVGTYKTGGSYAAVGANPKTLFANCYIEGGQGRAIISARSLWLGGYSAYDVYGPVIMGRSRAITMSGIIVDKPSDNPDFPASVDILQQSAFPFRYTSQNSVFALRDLGTELGFGSGSIFNSWMTGQSTTRTFGRATHQPYKSVFTSIVLGGMSDQSRQITILGVMPSSGDYARGDVVFNSSASAGGKVGWVCTTGGVAGSTAVFKPFGAIDA